jgi:hypothetical protein
MSHYQIRIKDNTKTVVKAFSFDVDKVTAYDMIEEWGTRYTSDHKIELVDKASGTVLHKESCGSEFN